MSVLAMGLVAKLQQRLADWFAQALPAEPVRAPACPAPSELDASEAHRKSIHDVTLEQLGLAHWSCHTLF